MLYTVHCSHHAMQILSLSFSFACALGGLLGISRCLLQPTAFINEFLCFLLLLLNTILHTRIKTFGFLIHHCNAQLFIFHGLVYWQLLTLQIDKEKHIHHKAHSMQLNNSSYNIYIYRYRECIVAIIVLNTQEGLLGPPS